MKQETVIINGIKYDAATGLPIEAVKKPVQSVKVASKNGKLAPKVVGARVVLKKTPAAEARGTARAKRPQKSTTLNRRYVSKPVNSVHVSAPKTTVAKHPEVSHFNSGKPLPAPVKLPAKPVAKFAPKPIVTPKNLVLDIRKPAPTRPGVSKPVAPKPSPKKALPLEEVDNVFSEVTRSIEQEAKKDIRKIKKSSKSFYVITGVIVVVLIVGILAVFRLPQIEMLIASSQAGVSGNIPSYSVPGYKIDGSINYATGRVKIAYRNDRQDETYQVVESKTADADQGLVIGNGTATMTKNGIRYQITYSSLSEEQVRRIADSF
jgi:hypothetical protein